MPKEIEYDESTNTVRVVEMGTLTNEEFDDSIATILEFHEKYGTRKVLVDTRAQTGMPGTTGAFHAIQTIPRGMRYAILVKDGQPTLDTQAFSVNVAVNRGFAMRIFTSETDAIEWLNS